ncbi:MAG: hypothetical protein QOH95_1575, partial [Gaiellaceae bacterium]|nr:hypothetical protein [Gaiellaceae bacterium]
MEVEDRAEQAPADANARDLSGV